MAWLLSPLPPKWHAALRDVKARGVEARIAAAVRLGEPDGEAQAEQALAALATLAQDGDGRVRAAAVQALGEIGDARCAPVLEEKLEDSDPLVRELATVALGELPWEDAGAALLSATRSPRPEVRFQAATLAAASGGEHAAPQLARLIEDPDPRVRASAVEAASLLEPVDRAGLTNKLVNALADPDLGVSGRAAILLAGSHPEPAAPILLAALDHPELYLDALDSAGLVRDAALTERVAVLAQRLLSSRVQAAAAARALARMRDPRGVPALREILGGFRTGGRNLVVQTIGELGLVELAPELLRLATRPRAVDPRTLARSLARLGELVPEVARTLQDLAKRDDPLGAAARAELDDPLGSSP